MKPYDPIGDREQRYAEIKAARDKNLSYREIGRQFGISHERVRQILAGGSPGLPGWQGRRAAEAATPPEEGSGMAARGQTPEQNAPDIPRGIVNEVPKRP